ncbi:ATP-binding protein [Streptomyces sp. SA15]|uniref:ATP-binding protein n=1 Tax=Streptomyces sp. SA15 TaxID=934019 RepID=UPI000BAFFB17|nr:ATP-binding protein [Streptomyces sp. SA15]PAZ10592.1 ATP-binding protein [Streptomyces sp. SA15]
MQDPQPPAADVDHCVTALRTALAAHGITLPSLRADLPTFAGTYAPPVGLVALGNCNTVTARKLAAVLRGGLDLDLPATPKAVPDLRRAVRLHLGGPCADVQLCVTELVANVIRHVGEGTPVRVRVARVDGGRIRIEVTDPDTRALPVLVHATGDDEAGRGLALLDAVALRWGVEQGASGKTVWCELAEGE